MANEKWNREQTIVALSVYCQVPFNKANNSNKLIQEIAPIIGRSANALKMKIGNFGRFDPILKSKNITGLKNGSQLDEIIWNEYCDNWESLAYDAAKILARMSGQDLEEFSAKDFPDGKERENVVKRRINQSFFREAVLSSYDYHCCITGFSVVRLLEACHIASWSSDVKNRLNPSNGLCMSSIFHKAYDDLLLGISPDYKIHISDELIDNSQFGDFFIQFDNRKIQMPTKFFPNKDLLDEHFQKFIQNS